MEDTALPKRRGPKPRGDRPTTNAERVRQHRTRVKQTMESLAAKGYVTTPLLVLKSRLDAINDLARELNIAPMLLLGTIADAVLMKPLMKYALLPSDSREEIAAKIAVGDPLLFEVGYQIRQLTQRVGKTGELSDLAPLSNDAEAL